MKVLEKIKYRVFPADPDDVAAYQTVLPKNIHISLKQDGDYIIAKVDGLDESRTKGLLITEAKDIDALISNVNDLIFTYVKMPDNIRPYYGNVFKPDNYKQDAKDLVLVKA